MKWTNWLSMIAVISLVVLLAFGLTRRSDFLPSPLVGETTPGFSLPVLDEDRTVSLDELQGRPVVVNFWASWCLACIQEHPVLVRAWERYAGQGVEMVGIVYQDTPANARRYIEKYGGGWLQLLDPRSRAAIDFGVYGVPETFFIRPDGIIAHKHLGPVTDTLMTELIEGMMEGTNTSDAESAEFPLEREETTQ
ncbi:MAG: TlpA disulfide reductase family protein [Gemmatimonadota bacterium]|nr:MAG: TlpA disulfide reductase family protein [Gemmatimonadota bacterium]